MQVRGDFQGYGLQGVDEKGRVAIPADLRQVLEANNPRLPNGEVLRSILYAPSETDTCVIAYDHAYPVERSARLKARAEAVAAPGAALELDIFRVGNGIVDSAGFDASGRFVLQGWPREFAQIGSQALFLSIGPYFEIWNPDILLEERGHDRRIRGMVEYLVRQRGAK